MANGAAFAAEGCGTTIWASRTDFPIPQHQSQLQNPRRSLNLRPRSLSLNQRSKNLGADLHPNQSTYTDPRVRSQ